MTAPARSKTAYLFGAVVALVVVNVTLLGCFGGCPVQSVLRGSGASACSRTDFWDNIGALSFESRLSFEPIDVVYTWVNGSDPRWLAQKEQYAAMRSAKTADARRRRRRLLMYDDYRPPNDDVADRIPYDDYYPPNRRGYGDDDLGYGYQPEEEQEDEEDSTSSVNGTVNGTIHNVTEATPREQDEPADIEDESASASRYRDSGELRYSLRSLEKYAPWIRHVYIVTDNQIPDWLNLDSPRLTVVPHAAIFPKKTLLPVFSSPAIEAHLHRIPNLSRRFVYFNDDVMLGAPTWPDDFVRLDGAQRVYLAWAVPKCAEGCNENWLGDGTCDEKCNVEVCAFDAGDCANGTTKRRGDSNVGHKKQSNPFIKTSPCSPGCQKTWLGDGVCDNKCDKQNCAYDAGDCGGPTRMIAAFPFFQDEQAAEVGIEDRAAVFNVSSFLRNGTLDEARVHCTYNATLAAASIVHDAVLLTGAKLLVVFLSKDRTTKALREVDRRSNATIATWKIELTVDEEGLRHKTMGLRLVLPPDDEAAVNQSVTNTTSNTTSSLLPDDDDDDAARVVSCDAGFYGETTRPKRRGSNWVAFFGNISSNESVHVTQDLSVSTRQGLVATSLSVPLDAWEHPFRFLQGGLELTIALPTNLGSIDANYSRAKKIADNSTNATDESGDVWIAGTLKLGKGDETVGCASFLIIREQEVVNATASQGDSPRRAHRRRRRRRRLLELDSYGESLVRVNRLYTAAYGKPSYENHYNSAARRVPAHMPHMIDVEKMSALQRRFPEEWDRTARNRFRSGTDMQYAFAYMHYLVSAPPRESDVFGDLWRTEIDADGDGFLSANEVRTLAAMSLGKEPTDAEVGTVAKCVDRPLWFFRRQATLQSTRLCAEVVNGVLTHEKTREERRSPAFVLEPNLDEVAFEMLSDDFNATQSQLDSIRARRTKFICVNDNVNKMTPEIAQLLQAFFESFYPKPSQFELPPGAPRNRRLHLDSYLADKRRQRLVLTSACFALASFGALLVSSIHSNGYQRGSTSEDLVGEAADRRKAE